MLFDFPILLSTRIRLLIPILVSFLSFQLAPLSAHSREGFNETTSGLPPAVAEAWDSVFQLQIAAPDGIEMGTAFVIKIDRGFVYFATANHTVGNRCLEGRCPNAALRQNSVLERFPDRPSYFYASKGSLTFDQISVHKRSVNPDFAILKAAIPADFDRSRLPRPLPLNFAGSNTGEKVYLIGFPVVQVRTCTTARRIFHDNQILKRWSEGIQTGERRSDNNGDSDTRYWVTSSTDSLKGNSGGPLLNANGDVISVQVKSMTTTTQGSCYTESRINPASLPAITYGIRDLPNPM